MVRFFKARNKEEHTQALARYQHTGLILKTSNIKDSNLYCLLQSIAKSLSDLDFAIEEFYKGVTLLETESEEYIVAWERMIGIPDECFDNNGSLTERKNNILIKLRSLNVITESDITGLINLLGYPAVIRQGITFATFPLTLPAVLVDDIKDARFIMVVDLPESLAPTSTFPMTFPFQLLGTGANLVECLVEKIKPANVLLTFNYIL